MARETRRLWKLSDNGSKDFIAILKSSQGAVAWPVSLCVLDHQSQTTKLVMLNDVTGSCSRPFQDCHMCLRWTCTHPWKAQSISSVILVLLMGQRPSTALSSFPTVTAGLLESPPCSWVWDLLRLPDAANPFKIACTAVRAGPLWKLCKVQVFAKAQQKLKNRCILFNVDYAFVYLWRVQE